MDEQNKQIEPVVCSVPAETKPRRPVRHMIWAVCLIAFALMLLGSLLGVLVYFLLIRVFAITDGATLFALEYFTCIGEVFTVLLYTLLCEKPIFRSFGPRAREWGGGNTPKLFGLGLLAGFGMNALCVLLAWLHGDLVLSVGAFRPLYLLFALVCVLIQSVSEELMMRGYVMGAIRQRYPLWVAVAVNALFFGALHLLNNGITVLSFANIVLFGLFMSFVMIKLKSLWFCIAAHTAWNYSQSIFFGLPNSGIVSEGSFFHLEAARDSVFYSAAFGVEGSITTALVNLAAALLILLVLRIRQKPEA